MTLRLKPTTAVGPRTQKIVQREIDASLHNLSQDHFDEKQQDDAIHDIRKRLKKVRAVLRLVRAGLHQKTFRREKNCFRETAEPLRDVRDAQVLIETFDKLLRNSNDNLSLRACADFREFLETRKQQICDQFWATSLHRHHVMRHLRHARRYLAAKQLSHLTWPVLRRGLKEVYIAGSQAFSIATTNQTAEHLHDWRKQVKCLWYQLQVLKPVWEKMQDEFGHELDQLAEILGDDHDLAMLHQVVMTEAIAGGHDAELEDLTVVIDRRRSELERAAFDLGRQVYRHRPKVLMQQIDDWWKA
ncbi:MAG: CHAD domain-containing protein [Planctomycetota bacterium]